MDPPVSKTRPSDFAELGSAEQIVVPYIGRKQDSPDWQTGSSGFSRKQNFPRFDQKPDTCCTKSFTIVFSSLKTCCTVKSSKRAIIYKHLSR
jgi:hypothetical protein